MQESFNTIGLISRHHHHEAHYTFLQLVNYLQRQQKRLVLDEETAKLAPTIQLPFYKRENLGQHCDLVIVVGGDGSLLHAARAVVDSGTPILGINRGRLGFLTDIKPDELEKKLDAILQGEYLQEERFLLEVHTENQPACSALNDIVLKTGDASHMMEFEVYVNNAFVCSERSDGMIFATPTGSTAYALSGGGPIIHPALNAIVLVSMFSHTLSSRPIVIPGDSEIKIIIGHKDFRQPPQLSADGEKFFDLKAKQEVYITKKQKPLFLLHPADYDYFENVRSKLYWGKN